MPVIRNAALEDIPQINEIEMEYYEGFSVPEDILTSWIMDNSDNFLVIEEKQAIVGFIFFEFVKRERPLPFVHLAVHSKKGKIAYVSEIGVKENDKDILQLLVEEMVARAKSHGCEKILWLTGKKKRHDKIETLLLENNGFVKYKPVTSWEAYPGHFVNDHCMWEKPLL